MVRLATLKDKPANKIKAVCDTFRSEMPFQAELQALLAEYAMIKYKALLKEGFTKEETLFLIK